MAHQFKPGDLAVIVGAIDRHEDVGRVVEVVRLVYPGDRMPEWSWDSPVMTAPHPLWLADLGECLTLKREEFLMPLDGDSDQFKREMLDSSLDQALRLAGYQKA